MKLYLKLSLIFTGLLIHSECIANIGDLYGFGSRSGALAGATVAWGFDGYASYSNPAALSLLDGKRLDFSTGFLFMRPRHPAIDGVVLENDYTGDRSASNPLRGSVDVNYKDTVGQTFGIKLGLFPNFLNFSLGISAFLPYAQTSYLDSGEAFVPEYALERARTQRPQVELGMGARLLKGFHAGVGFHVALSVYGSAKAFLQSNSSKPSTLRFSTSVKPSGAPYFGLFYTSKEKEELGKEGHWSLGAVYRMAAKSRTELDLKSSARALDTIAALDFRFNGVSTLFYDPASLEVGGSWQITESFRTYAQVDYQFWAPYEAPALQIVNPVTDTCTDTGGSCGVQISPGASLQYPFRNILVPRLGEEWSVSNMKIRAGYSYRQGILEHAPSGVGNLLDPSRHIFTAGLGFDWQHFVGIDVPHRFDLHFSYQSLVPETVTKTPGNETGNLASQKIGAPGYTTGGKVFGGGASLSFEF